MKLRSSWIVVSVLALVAMGLAFGAVSIKTDGDMEADGQFVSNELNLPPLQVSSSALVTGLNAEFLGGLDSNSFAGAVHFHDDQYFTEAELSTSFGGSVVHWDNVTSVPADLADGDDVFTPTDPPCFDNLNRYVNCGNGTVTDIVTGLIWLHNTNCFGSQDWASANDSAAQLQDGQCGLTDGSKPGDWRLFTREDWEATQLRPVGLGCSNPVLTDTEGTGCFSTDTSPPFSGLQNLYWLSTTVETDVASAYFVNLSDGSVPNALRNSLSPSRFVWPVRGRQ